MIPNKPDPNGEDPRAFIEQHPILGWLWILCVMLPLVVSAVLVTLRTILLWG